MIALRAADLAQIRAQAQASYPIECCGILIGRREADRVTVTRLVPSANILANERPDRFEIDPRTRLDAMRQAEAEGLEMVGHYHSHPDHPARPSATDLAAAWEPDLVWLIVAVTKDGPGAIAAFKADDAATRFDPVGMDTLPDDC
ncbi:MAG: M67 family metallopeptidase [Rhodospirillales bacterium]|nr:M67 family metallopeptidase [Rhodospirillales bacterium]